jgi:hypothetical protein
MEEYEEISECLDWLMQTVRLYVRKDLSNQEMSEQIKNEVDRLSHLGKRVGGKMVDDIRSLCEEALLFIQESDNPDRESSLIDHSLTLKNDLWEL